jgi:hypothetical protein
VPTPVVAVDVQLGFRGQRHDIYTNGRVQGEVRNTLEKLGAKLRNNLVEVRTYPDVTYVTFEVIGSNKVDVTFHLEQLVSLENRIIQLVLTETQTRYKSITDPATQKRSFCLQLFKFTAYSTIIQCLELCVHYLACSDSDMNHCFRYGHTS